MYRLIHIHLLNLLDGSPHRVLHPDVISWAPQPGVEKTTIHHFAMTGSRLAMYIFLWGDSQPDKIRVWRMVLWDWRTGDLVRMLRLLSRFSHVTFQVFDRSSDGSGPIGYNCQVTFIDEFRIMVCCNYSLDDVFTVFNTFVPQDHPGNMRQFGLPPKYPGREVRAYLDRYESLGTVNRDGHLVADPTQAILVLSLYLGPQDPEVVLILRIQSLIEHACSMRTDTEIPWDEWGRSTVVMETPTGYTDPTPIVHGPHMLLVRGTRHGREVHHIHTFDFSRRGSAALPLSDGGNGGIERRAIFGDGRSCVFEIGDGMRMQGLKSFGDGIVVDIVSLLPHSAGGGSVD